MGTKNTKRYKDRHERKEMIFRGILYLSSVGILLLLIGFFVSLPLDAFESIRKFGIGFAFTRIWDPVAGNFGALVFIVGTLVTSCIALVLSIPFSISIALFLGEYFREGIVSTFLKSAVELLAGIPSIIYGFWGIFVLVPIVIDLEMKLMVINDRILPYGVGILTASVVLTVMIIPYSASIAREVITLVPTDLKEAAYSLGATRFEVIRRVVLPAARSGIIAGIVLSLGRALGETMAITMLIGNANRLPDKLLSLANIFVPINTMASVIANEFAEATDSLHRSSLIYVGLLLFLITMVINITGRYIIKKTSVSIDE
ncbi:MAG: phosphate ABC transporter permease subunit PstC [Deltaproteobacteria bacterium]|nr:phosphate ABC transporter permease subunit PstC [Candidatus Zymogenaceae bacterium]